MNIYFIWQDKKDVQNTHRAAVVLAENEESARHTYPSNSWFMDAKRDGEQKDWLCQGQVRQILLMQWCKPEDVKVQLLGLASLPIQTPMVVLDSFL